MSTSTITNLADLVRTRRQAKGLSIRELGQQTGTSMSSMNRLELQNIVPLAPSIFRIADVLDIDLETLKTLVLQCANAGKTG
jgi:transcriptional regulator with XRE-family HTH domain